MQTVAWILTLVMVSLTTKCKAGKVFYFYLFWFKDKWFNASLHLRNSDESTAKKFQKCMTKVPTSDK